MKYKIGDQIKLKQNFNNPFWKNKIWPFHGQIATIIDIVDNEYYGIIYKNKTYGEISDDWIVDRDNIKCPEYMKLEKL